MRFLVFFLGLITTTTVTVAQSTTLQVNQNTRDQLNSSGLDIPKTGTLYSLSGPAGKVIGDPYLDSTWQAGTVKFYGKLLNTSDSLNNVPVRLDLMSHDIDIKAGVNDIRSAKAPIVRSVIVSNQAGTTSQFMNVREYGGDAGALSGFFEQVVLGKLTLLEYPSIYVKRANYNAAMSVGTKDNELIKKFDWYVAQDGKASKFSPGKKALLELMTDKKEQIEGFLKSEKPDLKSRSGLTTVFSYYNKL